MRKVIPFLTVMVIATSVSALADEDGYSLEEATLYRSQWTIDNWDDGGPLMRYVFLHMTEFWHHSVIDRSGQVTNLPLNLRDDVAKFVTITEQGDLSLSSYVRNSTVDAAVILHHGQIVFEEYPRMRPFDKHLYMSVSKALAATIIAILEDRELIDTAKSVDRYLPGLGESGWAGVTIRDVLDMASGIDCRQQVEGAYDNPQLCYYQFEASLGWLRPDKNTYDSTHEYIASLRSRRLPGQAFEYSSVNTFVLGWLAESVTQKTYADLVGEEIWQAMGAESDALLVAPKRGVQIASNGVSSTLRDMARFGLLFTPSGRQGTNPVVSDAYLEKIQNGGRPEIFNADRDEAQAVDGEAALHNSYQWDFVMADGDFFKGGYGGQGLYISPARDLVIAYFGAFDENGNGHEMTRIARQLAKSGLFH
jgi:CubicO group peptidase (beta-lactamase class C family)